MLKRIHTPLHSVKEGARSAANRKANQKLKQLVSMADWEAGQKDKFMSKICVNKNTKCWEWKAGKISTGYGAFYLNNAKQVLAHRLAFFIFNGPINGSLEVHHKCENPSCCNPKHLIAVSHRQNLLAGKTTQVSINCRKTHCINGHLLSSENLLRNRPNRQCRICNLERVKKRYQRIKKDPSFKEKVRISGRKYYLKNRLKVLNRTKQYYKTNREKKLSKQRAIYHSTKKGK